MGHFQFILTLTLILVASSLSFTKLNDEETKIPKEWKQSLEDLMVQAFPAVPIRVRTGDLFSPEVRDEMDRRVEMMQEELNRLDSKLKKNRRRRTELAMSILKNLQAQRQMKELQRSINHSENDGYNEITKSWDEFVTILNPNELKAARSLLESMLKIVKAGGTPIATDTAY